MGRLLLSLWRLWHVLWQARSPWDDPAHQVHGERHLRGRQEDLRDAEGESHGRTPPVRGGYNDPWALPQVLSPAGLLHAFWLDVGVHCEVLPAGIGPAWCGDVPALRQHHKRHDSTPLWRRIRHVSQHEAGGHGVSGAVLFREGAWKFPCHTPSCCHKHGCCCGNARCKESHTRSQVAIAAARCLADWRSKGGHDNYFSMVVCPRSL